MVDKKTITVLETGRRLADVLSLGLEELDALLGEMIADSDDKRQIAIQRILTFKSLAERYHTRQRRMPPPPGSAPDEILLRVLLLDPCWIPIVAPRGRLPAGEGALLVRMPLVTAAVTVNGERVALAAEDQAAVHGLLLAPRRYAGPDTPPGPMVAALQAGREAGLALRAILCDGLPRARDSLVFPKVARVCCDESIIAMGSGALAEAGRRASEALRFLLGPGVWLAGALAPPLPPQPARRSKAPARGSGKITNFDGGPVDAAYLDARNFLMRRLARIGNMAYDEKLSRIAVLQDFYRQSAMHAFLAVLIHGQDSKEVEDFLREFQRAAAEAKEHAKIGRRISAAVARARQYALIVDDKLGGEAAQQLRERLGNRADDPRVLLSVLRKMFGKPAVDVVSTEYENRSVEWRRQVENKCPHVALMTRLRASVSADDVSRLLGALEKYCTPLPEDSVGWIMCGSCGHRLMCSHVDEMIRMQQKNTPYDALRTRLMRYAERVVLRGQTFSYFCRICSERLAGYTTEDRTAHDMGAVGYMDEKLRLLLWNETMKAITRVKFSGLSNPRRFAGLVADMCHPLLMQAEYKLLRAGERRQVVLEPRVQLHAILFVHAYILNLIITSAKDRAPVGYEKVAHNAQASVYVRAMMEYILRHNASLIAKIENINDKFIAGQLLNAYHVVRAAHGPQLLTAQDSAQAFMTEVVAVDPIFHYAALVARVCGEAATAQPKTPADAGKIFATVMGRTLQEVVAPKPEGVGKKIEIPRGVHQAYAYKEISANLYKDIYTTEKAPKPAKTAFGLRERDLFMESYALLVRYTTAVVSPETWDAFRTQYKALVRKEYDYLALRNARNTMVFYNHRFASARFGERAAPLPPVTMLYDENGRRHVWDRYVYAPAGGPAGGLELAAKDLRQLLNDTSQYLVDMRCSVCGVLRSEAARLDARRAAQALREFTAFDTFFMYYESRCPRGGLHEFHDARCAKCGVSSRLLSGHSAHENAVQAHQYYNEYVEAYNRERASSPPATVPRRKEEAPQETVEEWPYDYGLVIKAAGLLPGVTPACIEAIGDTEDRDYTEVVEGQNVPELPSNFNDPRLLFADGAVRCFMADYNALRYKTQLEAQGRLVEHLPDARGLVGHDYHRVQASLRIRRPASAYQHAIETLCRMVVGLAEMDGPPWLVQLRTQFAKDELKKILQGSRLLSRPGDFSFTVFGKDIEIPGVDDSSQDNLAAYDGPGVVGEDVLRAVDAADPDADGAATNPFSLEDLDVDTTDNLEVN